MLYIFSMFFHPREAMPMNITTRLLKSCLIISTLYCSTLQAEKLILIDGIAPLRTGQCQNHYCDDRENYLWDYYKDELNQQISQHGANVDIHAFRWTGDMVKHGEQLKTKFRHWFFSQVCPNNQTCVVSFIAHSWGTVIVTDFLASQENNHNIKIRTMVTFGSPATGAKVRLDNIPFIKVTPFWLKAIEKVTHPNNHIEGKPARWVNIVSQADPVAWDYRDKNNQPISGIENLTINGNPSNKGRLWNAYTLNESELDPQFLPTVILSKRNDGIKFLKEVIESLAGVVFPDDFTNNLKAHDARAYQPHRLINYVIERLPSQNNSPVTTSQFDGAGSLIEPQTDCYGCNKDIAIMQAGNQASTVVFQWKNEQGRCAKLKLDSDLNQALVSNKSWSDTNVQQSYLVTFPTSIRASSLWQTTAISALHPLNQAIAIYASCDNQATETNKQATDLINPIFTNAYYWAGNGSIISKDSRGNSFGNTQDVAITHNNRPSLTAFQWQASNRCHQLQLLAEHNFRAKLKVKPWNSATYNINKTVNFPYTLNQSAGYFVISIETDQGVVPTGKIYAICQ